MPQKRLNRPSAVEEMHKRVQRPGTYHKDKLFKHASNNGTTAFGRRSGSGEHHEDHNCQQSTSNNSFAEEMLTVGTTKSSSLKIPPSYWSNSSVGYFGYRQQKQYAAGHRHPRRVATSSNRRDDVTTADDEGSETAPQQALTLLTPMTLLPHGSNANLAMKRFSESDLEDSKQHQMQQQRYYGEFIMQNNHPGGTGATTNSSSAVSESGNSSQQCLVGKSSNTLKSLITNRDNNIYNKNNKHIADNNVITISVDEPEPTDKSTNKKRHASNRRQKTVTLNVDTVVAANPNLNIATEDTATTKFYQSFAAARKFAYPNMTLLRRINERYKKTEHFFVALKIFAFVHLILGLIMLALDWAQAALLWDESNPNLNVHRKIYLILRCLYPMYMLTIAAVSAAVALHKRFFNKTLKLLCIVLLAVSCLMPNDTILVQSVAEAIQFSTVKRQLTSKEITDTLQSMGQHYNDDPLLSPAITENGAKPKHASIVPRLIFSTTRQQTTKRPPPDQQQETPDFSITLNEIVNNPRAYKNVLENYIAPYVKQLETFNTVHHLRIAYCLFGVVHLVLTVLTLFTAVRLESVP